MPIKRASQKARFCESEPGLAWHTLGRIWIFALILIGLSLIMSYGTNLARFAVVLCIAMHAAFNTVSSQTLSRTLKMPFELVLAFCGLAIGMALVSITRANPG
jgi:hypothetical protein